MRFLAPFLFLLTSISSIHAATLSLHAIDSATALVLVDGQIAPGDTHSLQAYIESSRTSSLKLAMVSFNSPGGNLEEGYKLATEIKRARTRDRSRGGENLCIGVLFRLRCRNDEMDGAQCAHRRPWRRRRQWRPVRDCCVRDHRHRPVGGKGTRHSLRHHWKNGYDATKRHHLAVECGIDINGRADARSLPFREFELERSQSGGTCESGFSPGLAAAFGIRNRTLAGSEWRRRSFEPLLLAQHGRLRIIRCLPERRRPLRNGANHSEPGRPDHFSRLLRAGSFGQSAPLHGLGHQKTKRRAKRIGWSMDRRQLTSKSEASE